MYWIVFIWPLDETQLCNTDLGQCEAFYGGAYHILTMHLIRISFNAIPKILVGFVFFLCKALVGLFYTPNKKNIKFRWQDTLMRNS